MKFFILSIVFILFIGLVSAENASLDCQYKEIKETNEYIQVLYDNQGNVYEDVIEIKNIAGSQGRISFDLINKIPLLVSTKVNYDISHSGGSFWPNQEEFHNITPLGTLTIINTGSSGILWGTSSVSNIRITYLSNNELEVKSEKKKEEVCKLCSKEICLNDGEKCSFDLECGSGTCNIASFCGKDKVTECPDGLRNCNNQSCLLGNNKTFGQKYSCIWECGGSIGYDGVCRSCLDGLKNCNNQSCSKPSSKKIGEKYSCEWECKSQFGKEGVCETTTKEKFLKFLFISLSLIILGEVIYFIWTNKNPISFFFQNDKSN